MAESNEQLEQDKDRLEALESDIQEVRSQTQEYKEQTEPHFVDRGEVDTEDVDDTIAPPG